VERMKRMKMVNGVIAKMIENVTNYLLEEKKTI
jgi:hypothetical protein